MGKKLFVSVGCWVPIEHSRLGRAYLHTKWHLGPYSRLVTRDIGRKLGCCAPLGEGELSTHLTQCRLS